VGFEGLEKIDNRLVLHAEYANRTDSFENYDIVLLTIL
jgi:hypothetical protein